MPGGPVIVRQARRQVALHGVNVTLTTYATSGSADTYGEDTWTGTASNIKAIFRAPRTARIVISPAGEEQVAEAEFWIHDTVSGAREPDRAHIVAYDGITYEVLSVFDEGAGLLHLVTTRQR